MATTRKTPPDKPAQHITPVNSIEEERTLRKEAEQKVKEQAKHILLLEKQRKSLEKESVLVYDTVESALPLLQKIITFLKTKLAEQKNFETFTQNDVARLTQLSTILPISHHKHHPQWGQTTNPTPETISAPPLSSDKSFPHLRQNTGAEHAGSAPEPPVNYLQLFATIQNEIKKSLTLQQEEEQEQNVPSATTPTNPSKRKNSLFRPAPPDVVDSANVTEAINELLIDPVALVDNLLNLLSAEEIAGLMTPASEPTPVAHRNTPLPPGPIPEISQLSQEEQDPNVKKVSWEDQKPAYVLPKKKKK